MSCTSSLGGALLGVGVASAILGCNTLSGVGDFTFGTGSGGAISTSTGRASSSQASTTGSGGGGGGGGYPACAPELEHGFDKPSWATSITTPGVTITFDAQGRLVIDVPAADGGLEEGLETSTSAIHFADCAIEVVMVQSIDGPGAATAFGVFLETNGVQVQDLIAVQGGSLLADITGDFPDGGNASIGPAPTKPTHLRVRDEAGQTYLARSADGAHWVESGPYPTPNFGGDPFVSMVVFASGSDPALPGKAIFQSFK